MLNQLEQKWRALPELVRWVLWLPLALMITAIGSFLGALPIYVENGFFTEWVGEIFRTVLSSIILLPLVYILIPRAKKFTISLFFALIVIVCLLTVFRIGAILYSESQHIEHRDAVELMQALVWLTVGVGTFRACMRGDLDGIQ